jgi:hypothetical protein
MDYNLGDKAAALADFREALELDPGVKRRFEAPAANAAPAPNGRGNNRMKPILDDADFMRQLFPDRR